MDGTNLEWEGMDELWGDWVVSRLIVFMAQGIQGRKTSLTDSRHEPSLRSHQ